MLSSKTKNQKPKTKTAYNLRRGIAALVIIFFITGIVAEIGLTVALISYLYGQGNLGLRASAEILAVAQAGIEDGLLRVIRRDFTPMAGKFSYALPASTLNNITANVTICEGIFDANYVNCTLSQPKQQILSEGILLPRKRRLVATLEVDPATRLIKIVSIFEVPF